MDTDTTTRPAGPPRLAAALAYRPETAVCRDCGERAPYAEMRANNRTCKRCWADYMARWRRVNRPLARAAAKRWHAYHVARVREIQRAYLERAKQRQAAEDAARQAWLDERRAA